MNFKHTGVFPEQAANWDYIREKVEGAGRPVRVLNLFAYTGGATLACGTGACAVAAAAVVLGLCYLAWRFITPEQCIPTAENIQRVMNAIAASPYSHYYG